MSSLATAPERAAPGGSRKTQNASALRLAVASDWLAGLALAGMLAVIVFVTTGGGDLVANTWTEIVLLLLGAAAAVCVLLFGAPGRRYGAVTLVVFAALAALTALSIGWSVQPDNSWLEANRTVSYFAVFAAGMALARLFPERWPAVAGGIAVLATVISGYALLVKVFPGTLDPQETLGRLRAPFDYWNATGLIAALGLPGCLWAGARRERSRAVRALAPPAIAVLLTVIVMSFSRSAVLAAVAGVALWFALVPIRLRGALVLAIGLAGAALLSGWALATHGLTDDHVTLASRTDAGHGFGIVLVLILVGLTAVSLVAAFLADRTVLVQETRRRLGTALVVLVALLPVAGIGALAASQRGFTGEVSHIWHSLTNTKETVRDNPGRLVQLDSSRARDWSEGWRVFEHMPLHGAGALGYATARTRYTSDIFKVDHAHSYVVQTLADFGLIGLVVSLALLVAWGLATRRTLAAGMAQPAIKAKGVIRPGGATAAERIGLLTLLCVVVAFGVHSAIDWTWFIPGTAIPALLCAGWLAGRGPLPAPVGRRAERVRLSLHPATGIASTALVVTTLLAAWAIWQPLRSDNAAGAVIAELSRGNTAGAFADARAAAARDPLSVQPLWLLSSLYSRIGDQHEAHVQLVKAISLQPQNPATWLQLGLYDIQHAQPHKALGVLEHAQQLDLNSPQATHAIAQARTALASAKTGAGGP